jgi:hypothetical protein
MLNQMFDSFQPQTTSRVQISVKPMLPQRPARDALHDCPATAENAASRTLNCEYRYPPQF